MKRSAIIIGILALLGGGVFAYDRFGPTENPDPNHIHADFAVWINGTQFDFSDEKYMSAPPQSDLLHISFLMPKAFAHEEEGAALPGREYLHLHDGNGHVIHRHKPGLTIGDFFASIGFRMEDDCFVLDTEEEVCNEGGDRVWRMFVNGGEMTFDHHYVFQDLDRILLTYGSSDDDIGRQQAQLTNDACLYSRTCPWRGGPPVENCIADPAVPCVIPE